MPPLHRVYRSHRKGKTAFVTRLAERVRTAYRRVHRAGPSERLSRRGPRLGSEPTPSGRTRPRHGQPRRANRPHHTTPTRTEIHSRVVGVWLFVFGVLLGLTGLVHMLIAMGL